MHDLIDTLPANERYSYVFDGNSQTLDHILVSDNLLEAAPEHDVVHVNAEFADQSSDHDPQVSTFVFNAAPTAVVTGGQCAPPKASGRLDLVLGDGDGDALTFTLVSNSNPTLVRNSAIIVRGSGTARTVRVTAVANKSGMATLTFELSDGTTTVPVVITVTGGTAGGETLTGGGGTDMMFGLNGNDIVNGGGGNDLLCAGNGADTLSGDEGNDVLDGQAANDILSGGDGNDVLLGGANNDRLTGGADADTFRGGPGADIYTDFNAGEGDTN